MVLVLHAGKEASKGEEEEEEEEEEGEDYRAEGEYLCPVSQA